MTVRSASLLALLALAACAPIRYEREVSPLEPEAAAAEAATFDLPLPELPPMREAFTSYHRILSDGPDGERRVVGYAVRYDEIPRRAGDVERGYPTGTVFLEDTDFQRVGFLTSTGRGYRYEGAKTEEVGQGTIEYLLPRFFAGSSFEVAAIE
ncbi:MAG: hypothetical protein ACF8XB_20280 [Planctomycetota bacterium JB042]